MALCGKVKHGLSLLISLSRGLSLLELVPLCSKVKHGLSLLISLSRGLSLLELVPLSSKVQHSLSLLSWLRLNFGVALGLAVALVFDLRQVDVLFLLDGDAVGEGGEGDDGESSSHFGGLLVAKIFIIAINFGGGVVKLGRKMYVVQARKFGRNIILIDRYT